MAAIPLARARHGRLLGGVCAGLARGLRVPVGLVRFAFLLGVVAGGVGIVAYGLALVLLPVGGTFPPPRPRDVVEDLAGGAIVLGAFLACRAAGLWPGDLVAVPGAAVAAGVALVWGRAEPVRRSARRVSPWRAAVGVTLAVLGTLGIVTTRGDLDGFGQGAAAVAVVVLGLALVLGPAVGRLVADLGAERRQRIRSEERAEISAHLHDSVLQTLTLIQRRADDDREVQRLARRQERELRAWLLEGDRTAAPEVAAEPTSLVAAVRATAAEVEDDHGVRIEVVAVGDAPLDERTQALAAAGREAMANAARHSGAPQVDVYVEVARSGEASIFVRDRGCGFEPAAVPADRRGLAASIVGRVERAGGEAVVHSTPGEGTEVELRVGPRTGRSS